MSADGGNAGAGKRSLRVDGLALPLAWIILSAWCVASGWILSLSHALNQMGYTIALIILLPSFFFLGGRNRDSRPDTASRAEKGDSPVSQAFAGNLSAHPDLGFGRRPALSPIQLRLSHLSVRACPPLVGARAVALD